MYLKDTSGLKKKTINECVENYKKNNICDPNIFKDNKIF